MQGQNQSRTRSRIVAGADGSPGSASALRWAGLVAACSGAELVVMTGCEPPEAGTTDEEARQARLSEVESWARAAGTGEVPVRAVVEPGDPRPGILTVAEREGAALIVVGRVGMSAGPGVFHVGSMAEWLAHNTGFPLAVVGGDVNPTIDRILVGVDGSDGSRSAVRWVRDMVAGTDIEIVVASVEQPYVEWTPASSPKNWRRALERRIVEDFAADLTADRDVSALALPGSKVADVLLQAAKEESCDVVVVGARGLGGFTGLRIGGVAIKTLHRADRPVVIIPPD